MSRKNKKILLLAALGILLVSVAAALMIRALSPKENTNDFRVYFDKRSTVAYNDTVRDGKVYINAFALAEYCEMTVSGGYERIKLYSDSGEWAVFVPGGMTADICGSQTLMPSPAYYDKDTLWLPCDFINSAFVGVDIVIDREHNKLSVFRTEGEGSTTAKPVYVPVTFLRGTPDSTVGAPDIQAMIDAYLFTADIGKYKKYLDPTDGKYLLLVNKTKPLGEAFTPSPLSAIEASMTIYGGEKQLEECAAGALAALMTEMRAAGYADVFVTSAYRAYSYQSALFNTYINKEMSADSSLSYAAARERVLTYSAEPGTSEHQSGLCVDFITSGMSDLDESFAEKQVYRWLCDNAYKFGFILRYPEDKTAVTGYSYEPWHYRFVGQHAAAEMQLSGECLEEYLAGR